MFHALSDSTRRAMVARLVRGPASMSQLAKPFGMVLPTVSQHLRVLEQAQVVSSQKNGRVRTFQLIPDGLVPAHTWIISHRTPRADGGTRLTFTEQGVHLDGVHGPGPAAAEGREAGTAGLLDALGAVLEH